MGNTDDRHRNPNMNNKDHLVGQLTKAGLGEKVAVAEYRTVKPGLSTRAEVMKKEEF